MSDHSRVGASRGDISGCHGELSSDQIAHTRSVGEGRDVIPPAVRSQRQEMKGYIKAPLEFFEGTEGGNFSGWRIMVIS